MTEVLLNAFASYGLPGLIILGMGWALWFQAKSFQEERKLWNEERKAWSETNEKYIETSIEVIQSNSKALAELTVFIQDVIHYPQNPKVQSRAGKSKEPM